jgi:tRNA(Ile)-lysidine synthase
MQPVPLILPGLTRVVSLQIQIVAVLIENDSQIVYNDAMERFRLDRMAGCVVRTRRPGDHVQPAGRCGKTLKKFLIEQHVPRVDRDRLPLIARDSAIVWLPGYAVGAAYRAETDSPYPWIGLRIEPLQQAVSVTEGLSGAGLIL